MKRILLVDNQAHVLRVMKLSLDRNGYEVDTALSADVALGMLRKQKYDVLITDNSLSKMDGQQLIDTIADQFQSCLLYTSPSPRDGLLSRMPSSA